jgi:glutaredoxin-related protein
MRQMKVQLFVKSTRTSLTTGHVTIETIGAAHTSVDYADGATNYILRPEEARAKSTLRREGIKFETIDISSGFRHRIQARFKGIRETPTLLDQRNPSKRYVGTEAILAYIEETKAAARRSPAHWTAWTRWV